VECAEGRVKEERNIESVVFFETLDQVTSQARRAPECVYHQTNTFPFYSFYLFFLFALASFSWISEFGTKRISADSYVFLMADILGYNKSKLSG
jgi:hypothetical protein